MKNKYGKRKYLSEKFSTKVKLWLNKINKGSVNKPSFNRASISKAFSNLKDLWNSFLKNIRLFERNQIIALAVGAVLLIAAVVILVFAIRSCGKPNAASGDTSSESALLQQTSDLQQSPDTSASSGGQEPLISAIPGSDTEDTSSDTDTETAAANPNARGNSTGNISNVGNAATDGEWVFYRSNNNGSLYRMRQDGSESAQLTTDSVRYINVLDGWVYYKSWDDGGSLYKIRTDGADKTKLNSEESNYINVVGSYIYYSTGYNAETEKFGALCRINTDGTGHTVLNDDWSDYINVIDGYIYYCNRSDNGYLYKIRDDGAEKQKLNDDKSIFINVSGGWVYYGGYDGSGESEVFTLYKMRTDGTERTQLSPEYCMYINVDGDWIYYSRSLGSMGKIRTDGTERTQLDVVAKDISVIDGWIYHYFDGKEPGHFKVKPDGTERQILN
ncbi:MAG: DUF5050 domain-containing protein [Clostridiales bacterium]|jgi:uncharacterized protein YchJ|nr:DUF5050 domain-containing protein [Clostridiales bacterium]